MEQLNPAEAYKKVREESQRDKQAVLEAARRQEEYQAAYSRRYSASNRLMRLWPNHSEGRTLDVEPITASMIECAQGRSQEWVQARVAFVRLRMAALARKRRAVAGADRKQVLLDLLLCANAGQHQRVVATFSEVFRGEADEVESFRSDLVNWLMDKVVEGLGPLPAEVKQEDPEEERPPGPVIKVQPVVGGTGEGKERLYFDAQTQTVTLDGTAHKVTDPKAFAVYKLIAESCPQPITKASLQKRVAGCRGAKKVRQLLNSLPTPLGRTISSGPNGYWLDLNPSRRIRPNQRRQKKGRT
jgi:hypothetical protein